MSTLKPDQIADIVGFDQGDKFKSPREVREYFQLAELRRMMDSLEDCDITQHDLNFAARWVIAEREHCDFAPEEEYDCLREELDWSEGGDVDVAMDWYHAAELHRRLAEAATAVADKIVETEKEGEKEAS